jgi:hypothetical protein
MIVPPYACDLTSYLEIVQERPMKRWHKRRSSLAGRPSCAAFCCSMDLPDRNSPEVSEHQFGEGRKRKTMDPISTVTPCATRGPIDSSIRRFVDADAGSIPESEDAVLQGGSI